MGKCATALSRAAAFGLQPPPHVEGLPERIADSYPDGLALVTDMGGFLYGNARARALLPGVAPWRSVAITGEVGRAIVAALGERRLDVWVKPGVHVLVWWLDRSCAAVLMRVDGSDLELHRALVTRLGMDDADARVAVRVYRGLSNRQMAATFGIPEGTVKWRLHRLFRRIGARDRAALCRLVEAVARSLDERQAADERAVAPVGAPVADSPTRARMSAFVAGCELALLAMTRAGGVEWANVAARRLLDAAGPDSAERLAGVITTPAIEREEAPPLGLRARTFPIDGALVGVQLTRAQVRGMELDRLLRRRYRLAPREAFVARQIMRGRTHREVARVAGMAEGSVRGLAAAAYAKLGVSGRPELAVWVSRHAELVTDVAG